MLRITSLAWFPIFLFPTPLQDFAFLAAIAAAVTFTLRDAYVKIAQARAAAAAGTTAPAGTDAGAATLWGAVFQTNFWYFVSFGLLQYVLVPQMLDRSSISPVNPSSGRYIAYLDGAISALIPALTAFAVGRGKL